MLSHFQVIWRWIIVTLKGHWRSFKLVPFQSLGAVSYSPSIVTMAVCWWYGATIPSWYALQLLIKILERWCTELDIVCNSRPIKTVCMIFKPQNLDRRISADFPWFTLDNCKLKFLSQFRYSGHIINDDLKDDDDIKKEIKKLFVNTNILVNRFQRCSHNVKLFLFKSFCMCLHDLALWKYYYVTVYNKFKSAYNKCI